MARFKIFRQLEMTDCGPACVQMISNFYGKTYPLRYISQNINISRIGVTVADIESVCKLLGIETLVVQGNATQLRKITVPVILHWRGNHFVVLYDVKKSPRIVHLLYS